MYIRKPFEIGSLLINKITLHTEEARCVLYDTSPDFEAVFYNNTKFHVTKEGSIKITNPDGTSLILDSNSRSTCLSPDMQEMLEKSHKVRYKIFLLFVLEILNYYLI